MSPSQATFNFTGQVVCVSGGATGIGAASAAAFAAAGAHVIVADIAADDAHRTVGGITAAGGDARGVSCDVADPGAVDAMMDGILATEGRLDVVHANAGLESTSAATDVSLDEWHRVIGVNLTGVFLVCRAGLRHMYRQGSGVLVITSSPHALATVPDAAAYAASKGGVHALTRALALEAASRGIRVNALVPGAVAAGGFVADPALARHIPLGRLGQAEDLAPMALAILSNRLSAYVTGAAIVVDGGLSLTNWFEPPDLGEL